MAYYFYIAGIILELIFVITFCIFWICLIIADFKGSPFVPTKMKKIKEILQVAGLRKGQKFFDLGCGDGRVVLSAVADYQVQGVGVDINPLLIWYAKLVCWFRKIRNVIFFSKNISDTDLQKADVIYLFLMPQLISRLVPKFEKELKKNCLVISHGFKIADEDSKIFKTIKDTPFPTYFYRW